MRASDELHMPERFSNTAFRDQLKGRRKIHVRERSERIRVAILFGVALIIAIALEFLVLPALDDRSAIHRFFEHVTVALFVAFVLGTIFEVILHENRKTVLTEQIEDFRKEALQLLGKMGMLAPSRAFDSLLRDIAIASQKIPTLYETARDETEYKFVKEGNYFKEIIPVASDQVVKVLRKWIQDSHTNVKFLASDFVGKYRIEQLADDLRKHAKQRLQEWKTVPDSERPYVLNFLWAASRCETPQYDSLGEELVRTFSRFTQKWILFVPRQMPDPEFVEIIGRYLKRNKNITQIELEAAIHALAALQCAGHDVKQVMKLNSRRFQTPEAKSQIQRAWEDYDMNPEEILEVVAPLPSES